MTYNKLGYKKKWVGMIKWSYYWQKYSLILEIGDNSVTELDGFAGINHNGDAATSKTNGHKIRTHRTLIDSKDKIYTIDEFYRKEVNYDDQEYWEYMADRNPDDGSWAGR